MKKLTNHYLIALLMILPISHAHSGMMEEPWVGQVLFDKAETQTDTSDDIHWEMSAKLYQNLSGFVWKSSGERVQGMTESENMFLYSKGYKPYWDWQIGVGYDTADTNSSWGVIGVSGMAPYFFETEAHLLINGDGTLLKTRAERHYLITQKWMWVPELEATFASTDMLESGLGAGLSSVTLGLRLRYEISRKLAPYAGIEWQGNFGKTKELTGIRSDTSAVVGVRFWF